MEKIQFSEKFEKFLCDSPLYTPLKLSDDDEERSDEIDHIREGKFKQDMYCIYCKKESTFLRFFGVNHYSHWVNAKRSGVIGDSEMQTILVCQRQDHHKYQFSVLVRGKNAFKIGQYPSMESISNNGILKYRKVLKDQDYEELHRAGGLASHGIGIAPYVYLRRIFERLIYQHYEMYKLKYSPIDKFESMRIDEKIAALSEVLPPTLVQHKAVYKILSKGIHELDEDSCKKYYPVVRAVVVSILEEDLQRKEKERAATALQSELAKVLSELDSDGS